MTRRRARGRGAALTAALVAVLALATAGCSITFGDPDDDGASTTTGGGGTSSGTSGTTIEAIQEGEPMRWDVSTPISAESVGLGESMAVVELPGGAAEVELTLPSGVWSTTAEELTVEPRRGYVSTINVFRTLSGGQAVHDQLVADADVLGFPVDQIDRWLDDDLPASLEASRAGGTRARTGINGNDGDVVTSVQISHEPGPGGDEAIRLWYVVRPVTPDGEGE
ncbi:hypothetical protein [Cellulosimicrobium arenosum]|uniref:Lipoprotein n=1 Tax=Cellulosimicrobium arenosum TaxID=2708133 RepID=A0A927PDZ8_9MICO|nr:hypothetical protein [Cellulosimicrobium arenosum]MBD8079594.1 hypothetical protein [Cellulosimicrobium arenosum]